MQYKKAEYFDAIEQFIDRYKERNGGSTPSTTEIAAGIGLSQPTVSKYLKVMREQGVVEYDGYLNSIRNPNVMRSSTFVIVDEAHKLKEAAQDSFGEKISFNMISAYANWAKGRCRKEEDEDTFKEYLKDLTDDARCLFRRLKALNETDEDILDRADPSPFR